MLELSLSNMKLRIISGELKHRAIEVPRKFSAKPMGSRVRTALFNSFASDIVGVSFLDAFGGSGACGLEALSRGAKSVLILEKDRPVYRYINKNLISLKLIDDKRIQAVRAPIAGYFKENPSQTFDLILADPPYELASKWKPDDESSLDQALQVLATKLNKGGTLVLSWPESSDLPEFKNLSLSRQRTYAGAKLAWYVICKDIKTKKR